MSRRRKSFSIIFIFVLIVLPFTFYCYYKKQLNSKNNHVPVLMYHHVKSGTKTDLIVSKKDFEKEMKYLHDNRYRTLTLDEAYNYIKRDKQLPKKSVVLTFDDGYKDNYENAYPILKKYRFKATIFMITNKIGQGEYLTLNQLKELNKNGFDIQSHTANHENLSKLSYSKQLDELESSKKELEKLLNKKVRYLAYPYGEFNEDTIKACKAGGYRLAFRINETWAEKDDGLYSLDRVFARGLLTEKQFEERVSEPGYYPIIKIVYHKIKDVIS
ncbi:polysaccharide deacetylase family protein [Haloimpatiens sp. FM7330]|uniref:polysaccharide deacetylase family protein n=1 Tax=Haloimpatiens sp. FM7330 TaxID=3298610 RepID=UPI003637210D